MLTYMQSSAHAHLYIEHRVMLGISLIQSTALTKRIIM